MKKRYVLFISILSLGLFSGSCSKDESGREEVDVIDKVVESGKLQFDVDGKTFVSTTVQAIVSVSSIAEASYISISGLNSTNGDFVQITVPSSKVGTYTLKKNLSGAKSNLTLAYSPTSAEYSAFIGLAEEDAISEFNAFDYKDTASIIISSIDTKTKKISGTFQFTGIRSNSNNKLENKIITKGSFKDITFTDAIPIVNNNTFSAKLDDTEYVSANVTSSSIMGKIAIAAIRGGVESIIVNLPGTIKPGTYDISIEKSYDYSLMYIKNATEKGVFNADSGTIVILSHDTTKKTISGTFSASFKSFLTTEKHEVNKGAFTISY